MKVVLEMEVILSMREAHQVQSLCVYSTYYETRVGLMSHVAKYHTMMSVLLCYNDTEPDGIGHLNNF